MRRFFFLLLAVGIFFLGGGLVVANPTETSYSSEVGFVGYSEGGIGGIIPASCESGFDTHDRSLCNSSQDPSQPNSPQQPSSPTTGTIQGYKVHRVSPQDLRPFPPGAQTVTVDDSQSTGANPYYFPGMSVGNHTVRVSVPAGWSVGYTLCYNTEVCPQNAPIAGDTATVSVPPGGFADLWWQFTPIPSGNLVVSVNNSAGPVIIPPGGTVTINWSASNVQEGTCRVDNRNTVNGITDHPANNPSACSGSVQKTYGGRPGDRFVTLHANNLNGNPVTSNEVLVRVQAGPATYQPPPPPPFEESWIPQSFYEESYCAPNAGQACTSAPNSCSMTNTDRFTCNGSCPAQPPPDEQCPVPEIDVRAVQANNGASFVNRGSDCRITWNTQRTTSCKLLNPEGQQVGSGTSGTYTLGNMNASTAFTLDCMNGRIVRKVATVTCRLNPEFQEI